jgi:hypothetical protein
MPLTFFVAVLLASGVGMRGDRCVWLVSAAPGIVVPGMVVFACRRLEIGQRSGGASELGVDVVDDGG